MNIRRLFSMFLLFAACSLQAANIDLTRITAEMRSGLVVTTRTPRLGWQMISSDNTEVQTSYELEVTNRISGEMVFHTGKVQSEQSQLVKIKTLPVGDYNWRVRVWNKSDEPSSWSDKGRFIITNVKASFGESRWIGAITKADAHTPEGRIFHGSEMKKETVKAAWAAADSLSRKSIYVRTTFTSQQKKVKQAVVNICGLGLYELSINGKKVGNSEFTPLISDYDKSVWYNTYDVTTLLQKGNNAIGVLLGNGFYNVQGGRYRKLLISFGPPTVRLQLTIHYEDGTSQTVASDKTWKYDFSPVTFNCIYGGEDYDARQEQKGWNMAKFNDTLWNQVVVQEGPKGVLRPQIAAPVAIMEHYSPISATHLPDSLLAAASKSTKRKVDASAIVLDMGQNLAGFPEITVKGKKGQTVTLLVAEALTPEGACNQRQTGRQHYYQYTLKGDGEETWHPRFSYYGFRYIQIEGATMQGEKNPQKLPVIKRIRSCFVYNSAPKVSTFECSNSIFNGAHRLIEKAVRSNMQGVFTDCPHREKLGWLEQDHLNGPGLLFNYDLTGFIPQTLQNIADAQHPNGAVPTTAPEYVYFQGKGMDDFAESPEWGCTLVVLPFMYYDFYGDDSLIHTYYKNMSRYVDYLATRAEGHILSFGLGDWYDYGNFRAGFSRNTPVPLVATAHYYMIVKYMIRAAQMVGNNYDEIYFTNLATEIRNAFNEKFYQEEKKTYGTGSQCSLSLPLYLGLTPEGDEKAVLNNLIADIKKNGNHLTTGDVGNRYLFQTFAENGLDELMYTMHNHEDVPGYGFQQKFGATTLTEQWDPRQGSSWNHFMMGQIDEWFFKSLAGIRSAKPGMSEVILSPRTVGDLQYVKASTELLYGRLTVEWKKVGDKIEVKYEAPIGCKVKLLKE